ncbi:MAG: hypothetical protein JWO35_471 [Candidatus Saccharibacteria bacterium]|nr:hypothetical protein [Candidatus Saccharibacteria bacterium]
MLIEFPKLYLPESGASVSAQRYSHEFNTADGSHHVFELIGPDGATESRPFNDEFADIFSIIDQYAQGGSVAMRGLGEYIQSMRIISRKPRPFLPHQPWARANSDTALPKIVDALRELPPVPLWGRKIARDEFAQLADYAATTTWIGSAEQDSPYFDERTLHISALAVQECAA